MRIVADTNIFLAAALEEPEKEQIIALTSGHELVAPEILPYEAGNALTALVKRAVLGTDEVTTIWEVVMKIPVQLTAIDIGSALRIATAHGLYAYDAYFLECAMRMRCPLLTLDRKMETVAGKIGIQTLELK